MSIGREGGLSTLCHSCGFDYQQRVLKAFPDFGQDCHKGIDDWEVDLFEKCETHKQFNERGTF